MLLVDSPLPRTMLGFLYSFCSCHCSDWLEVFCPCAFKESLAAAMGSAARRLKCLGCTKVQICISLTFEQASSRKVVGIIHETSYRKQNQH